MEGISLCDGDDCAASGPASLRGARGRSMLSGRDSKVAAPEMGGFASHPDIANWLFGASDSPT